MLKQIQRPQSVISFNRAETKTNIAHPIHITHVQKGNDHEKTENILGA